MKKTTKKAITSNDRARDCRPLRVLVTAELAGVRGGVDLRDNLTNVDKVRSFPTR